MTDAVDLWGFVQRVPDKGFEWRSDFTVQGEKPPFLMIHPDAKMRDSIEILSDEPGGGDDRKSTGLLFEQFAQLEGNPKAILGFANKWGWLGARDRGGADLREHGESLWEWKQAIKDFHNAYMLWRLIEKADGKVIVERIDDRIAVTIVHGGRFLLYRQQHELLFRRLDSNRRDRQQDRQLAVRVALVQQVNNHLKNNTSPYLVLNRNGDINPQPSIRPNNLLTAIWLQLHQALLGWRKYHPCIHCTRLVDVTDYRSTKKAHPKCVRKIKTARYRKRRKGMDKANLR